MLVTKTSLLLLRHSITLSLLPYVKIFLCGYFIIGMHIILDTPGGTGLYLSYNIIAWLFVTVFISLGLWQVALNQKIYYSKMLLWASLGCIFLVIPAFYRFEFTDHAIPRILALLAGLLFLFSLYQFKVTKKHSLQLLLLILVSVAIEAVFGLIQFFVLVAGDWGGYIIGKSRPHGVFLQPNVMASFMATGLAIALYLSTKIQHFSQQKLLKYFLYFCLFASSFLLVLLQSRAGQTGAVAALLMLSLYLYQKSKRQLALNLLIVTFSAAIAVSCLNNSELPQRGTEIYQSAGPRAEIFTVSLDMIKTKPIVGYGYGGFERSFIDHFNEYAQQHPEIGNTIKKLSHPHNEIFLWVIEGGIIAFIGLLLFAFGYLTTFTHIRLPKALACTALILPIFLHSQLEFPFYSSVSHWFVFLIMLWLADYAANEGKVINNCNTSPADWAAISCEKTFLIRFLALFIPAIFIPFLVTSMHTASILVEHEKSGFQSVDKLQNIINPIAWQSRLDAAVYAHILIAGVKSKDNEKLEAYIAWALQRIRHKPRVGLYKNILLTMKILAKEQQYQQLLIEAKNTYPQITDWHKNTLTLPNITSS